MGVMRRTSTKPTQVDTAAATQSTRRDHRSGHPPPPPPHPPPAQGGVYIWWSPLTIMVCTMTESAPLSKSERLIWAIMTPGAKRRYLFVGGPLDGQRRKICPLAHSYKCHGRGRSTWTYTRTKIFDDYNAAIVYATPGVAYDAVAAFVLRREPLDTSKEYERWLLRKCNRPVKVLALA